MCIYAFGQVDTTVCVACASLSEIVFVRHTMLPRGMYAEQDLVALLLIPHSCCAPIL